VRIRLCAALIACILSIGCGHRTTDAAEAPAASRSSHASAPIVAPAEIIPPAAATSAASLVGIAQDGDSDPVLPKNPFFLPGPVTADTGPDGLRRIYGAANVTEGDLPGAEGETVHGVILFANDPKRRAYVYYQDEKALTGLSMLRVMDASSQWRSTQGIRIGMPLPKLVAINHGPFEFLGFDWDYGGQITDWLGGKLASAKNGATLRVQLGHGELPKDIAYNKLPIGDHAFRSDHPQLARMKPVVAEMSMRFPGQDDR
jgi:hypothetical protein